MTAGAAAQQEPPRVDFCLGAGKSALGQKLTSASAGAASG
jgi:hypothetical protein